MQHLQTVRHQIACLVIGIMSLQCFAADPEDPNSFYKDRERGWFWHESMETTVDPESPPLEPQPMVLAPPKEQVALNVDWLKENMPILRDRAINNPTDENLANYAYSQRLWLDMSTRFANRMTDYMVTETMLDESQRRPTAAFALNAFQEERAVVVKEAIAEVKQNSRGIFFFFASDCGYCHKMLPVLLEFKRRHQIEILAISLDGRTIPGMEAFQVVADPEHRVAQQFNVSLTPTLHLVANDNSAELVVEGLKPLNDIEDRLLLAGRKNGMLSEELYAKTRSVRDVSVFKNEDGNLMADKERMENDPAYLAELLKMRLSDSQPFGTKLVK